ncbi:MULTISPECIES: hypothetical protein [unclassified Roseovarius]|nr:MULTISPECIES: hypothetical protein [unclassified Roseovarius]
MFSAFLKNLFGLSKTITSSRKENTTLPGNFVPAGTQGSALPIRRKALRE